jgi:putative membrane protein
MQLPSRETLLLFLKGMAMGAADSVPGVSGGTIALIANIYDELLGSIRSINLTALRLLFTAGPLAAFKAINGRFLLTLGLGVLGALLLSANLVLWLLEHAFTYIMCFFNGLILASVLYVAGQVPRWTAGRLLWLLLGLLFGIGLALLPPLSGFDSLLFYFFCGALAICAMILPGISGSFVLLLLGAYEPVLTALTAFDWSVIVVFAAGCGCGLLSFSHVLHWLLQQHRAPTLAGLLGILAGSLYSIWPWRREAVDAAGQLQLEYLPLQAADAVSGEPVSLLLAGLLVIAGFLLVWGLERAGSKSGAKSTSSGH